MTFALLAILAVVVALVGFEVAVQRVCKRANT
jgi:hypothetical protein